jgi:small-conductance mechanosensitive channel
MDWFNLPLLTEEQNEKLIYIIGVVLLMFVAIHLASRGLAVLAGKSGDPILAARAIRTLVRWVFMLIAAALILSRFQIDLWTFLTGILAMIAVGFVAVWSILSNILAAFIMILFKMFAVHDEIEFAGEPVKGRIVDFTLFFMVLRAEDGRLSHVPNNLVFQKVVLCRKGGQQIGMHEALRQEGPAG